MKSVAEDSYGCLWACLALAAFGIADLLFGGQIFAFALPAALLMAIAQDLREGAIGFTGSSVRRRERPWLDWGAIALLALLCVVNAWNGISAWTHRN